MKKYLKLRQSYKKNPTQKYPQNIELQIPTLFEKIPTKKIYI